MSEAYINPDPSIKCIRCGKNPVEDTFDICDECFEKATKDIPECIGRRVEQIFMDGGQIYVLYSNGEWEYR